MEQNGDNEDVRIPKRTMHVGLTIVLIVLHISLALTSIIDNLSSLNLMIDIPEFQRQLLISGIFLYLALFACWTLNILPLTIKSSLGIFLLSFAISILFAADKTTEKKIDNETNARIRTLLETPAFQNHYGSEENKETIIQGIAKAYSSAYPKNFSSTIYALVIERHAIFVLLIMALVIVSIGMYQLFKSFFNVEYSGSGIQIKIPGHMMYYVPVFPQTSWQNTGIPMSQGSKYNIELSGLVSPGSMSDISALEKHMRKLVYLQMSGNPKKLALEDAPIWPYKGPFGYDESWYGPGKPNFIKKHPLYGQDYFFKKDTCLTIMGLPHCKVVGMIVQDGDAKPRSATINEAGYNWNLKEDRELLINFSARSYPINITARNAGELWVVINDVDLARWDNTGLFFLKVTKQAWI